MGDWDAATYDRIADPMFRWGVEVVGRLDLQGSERVLDAGCGSGRVTEVLLERLPRGTVVALDASPAMLREAQDRLERFGDRLEFVHADLGRPLPVDGLVDAVLSTATFHWVRDHDALFRNLAAVMPPGTQLEAQCGAAGFTEIRVWTHEEPTRISPNERLETFLRTVCLRTHMNELTEDERDRFVHQVAEQLPDATIDDVRLNIHARRARW